MRLSHLLWERDSVDEIFEQYFRSNVKDRFVCITVPQVSPYGVQQYKQYFLCVKKWRYWWEPHPKEGGKDNSKYFNIKSKRNKVWIVQFFSAVSKVNYGKQILAL